MKSYHIITKATADAIRAEVERRNAENQRSAWSRGVGLYALELADNIREEFTFGRLAEIRLDNPMMDSVEHLILNGARTWEQYSEGGCSLCYDGDIAERLCTTSELRKTDGGDRNPNSRETWLDVQARALHQAATRVRTAARVVIRREEAEQQEQETAEA